MSDPFVADSSVAIGWVHPNQSDALTARLLHEARSGAPVHVPSLWHLEIANTLLIFVRRKHISELQRGVALTLLAQLRLVIDDDTSRLAFSTISELAANHTLSVYDAPYLELARRKSLPLATRDNALAVAAKKAGVKLCQP